ncbi:hypothetical protein CFP56_030350 [Quercus suber]|uniref:Uncharacterized protein n=1 Tax=Quercus suber TaxID=58331 RepID=A0AAW0JQC9_QUESU
MSALHSLLWPYPVLPCPALIGNTEGQVPKNDNGVYSEIERTRKQILHILEPDGEFLQMWNVMFIVVCDCSIIGSFVLLPSCDR